MKTNKQTNKSTNQQTNKPIKKIRRKIVFFFMSFTLCFMQSCSTEEVVLESESNSKTRDYSFKKISFLDLKNINNQVFIESAKLKKVLSDGKNKTVNTIPITT